MSYSAKKSDERRRDPICVGNLFCRSIGIQDQTPIIGSTAMLVILVWGHNIKCILFRKQNIETKDKGAVWFIRGKNNRTEEMAEGKGSKRTERL